MYVAVRIINPEQVLHLKKSLLLRILLRNYFRNFSHAPISMALPADCVSFPYSKI